jgi:hypothetical protein
MINKDEKISLILGVIGAIWLLGGIALLIFLARWLRMAWGITDPGLVKGLFILYLISMWVIAIASIYFRVRSYIKSGDISGIILFIFQIILIFVLGQAILRLLRGG